MLLKHLEDLLRKNKIALKDVDFKEIFDKIYNTKNNRYFEEFVNFTSTFINLFKSKGYDIKKFDELIVGLDKRNTFFYNRSKLFLELVKPIYFFYQNKLNETNKMDFNDMINLATSLIKENKIEFNYKYIIVDEYQDISHSKFNLINEIIIKTNAKLMCVGDDWQSIYRFTGSDLSLFTNFHSYFKKSEELKIEKTYRNSQNLIDIAGSFIMKNENQFKKNLVSGAQLNVLLNPVKILGYTGKEEMIKTLKLSIDALVERSGSKQNIILLGRNNIDISFLYDDKEFVFKQDKNNKVLSKYKKYPNIKISFYTAHRSKGLEADNVIIVNASNSLLGFPNRISDDPILSLVQTEAEKFEFAEERRLFYVALTRTKNYTYILVPDDKKSPFINELIKEQNINYEILEGNTSSFKHSKCPVCTGDLIQRKGNELFIGCKNYPLCNFTTNDLGVLFSDLKCYKCKNGYMAKKESKFNKYEHFYGCTNYPECDGKLDKNKNQITNKKNDFKSSKNKNINLNNVKVIPKNLNENTNKICPGCKGKLFKRKNKGNSQLFYGCENYPICKYTESYYKKNSI
jgi:DNA helicase-4